MPAINIVNRYLAIQYDGTNSAEIDGLIANFTIDSETGGVLSFNSLSSPFTVNTGDWIRYTQGHVESTHPDSEFQAFFVRNAIYLDTDHTSLDSDITDLDDRVTELESTAGTGIRAAGIALAPTLLLSASATVAVDFSPAMPNTSYTPHVQLIASTTALGSLSVTGTTVVDTNTVNVTVQNSGLVNLSGVQLLVTVTE